MHLVKMLPPSLRNEVIVATYGETIKKFSFFVGLSDPVFAWKLIPALK